MINAYCRVGNAEKADELLGELQEGANRPDTMDSTFADVITLALIVKTWSIQRKNFDQAIERAEAQLQEIINRYREGEVGPYEKHVDTWVFECVARIWLASKKPEAGERIEDLINRMADLHEEVPGLFHPSLNVYILALDAWASSGRGDAGKHALALLRKMRGLHRAGELPEPNIRTLSTAFTSVIQSPSRGAVKKAERLYQEILDLYQRGDRSSAVNARTLTTLLSAIFYSKTDDAIVRAMKVLRQTVSLGKKNSHLAPNSITFNACLNGLAQRRASDGAWVLFKEMKSLYSKGYDTRPDNVSYACVVRAVASSKRSPGEAMKRLDSLCSEITEAWERGELHPDIKLFNTMINSYNILSKFDPTAAEKANSLLVRLELSDLSDNHISPDLRTFRYVCHAYAVSKAPGSLQKAEETLRRAQSLAAEGRIESPDTDIYSSVVLAHTRSQEEDSLEKAEHLVESMEQLQKEGHAKAKPNTETYNILLSAYASSRDYQKVTKSLATIRIMNKAFGEGQKACEPDVNSYNWVRNQETSINPSKI